MPCPVRDGTVLRADVYRPAASGRVPVLLCRTPYDKAHPRYVAMGHALAGRGYIAVVQDIRGRNASDGEWIWHMSREGQEVESRDGFDACEWAATLRGSDGQVGTWGNSYPSWCIWRMAAARPPSLKAVFTSGFSVRTRECTSGIFETGIRLRWQHQMAVSSRRRAGDTAYPTTTDEAQHQWDRLFRGKWLWHLPLDDLPDELFGSTAGMQRQYWRNIATEFWALDEAHPSVAVPTCTLTGWWDRLNAAAGHYTGMVANGPETLRDRHRLIIGPWVHDVESRGDWVGPRDYGPSARLDLPDVLARWYDLHLKGKDDGLSSEAPVQLFILNENRWRGEVAWPLPSAGERPFFLDSGGSANTPSGDGVLRLDDGAAEAADRFLYDPRDPVPSLVEPDGQAAACDQRPLAGRRDILVYQTAALEEDILAIGPVACILWIASDGPDTDVVARLIEVGTDGLAVNISQGILRARYRGGYEREVPLTPGEPTEIRIPMSPIGIRFRRGSRVRLDVTSSDFPTFDRNHNTGRPFFADPELRPARQTLLHGGQHPSRLLMPVMDERA